MNSRCRYRTRISGGNVIESDIGDRVIDIGVALEAIDIRTTIDI